MMNEHMVLHMEEHCLSFYAFIKSDLDRIK